MDSSLRDNPSLSRFELDVAGGTAFVNYRVAGDVITLTHTEVPVHLRERGMGSRLVEATLREVRARGLKVVPRCPFISAYIRQHPEFSEVLA